LAQSCRNLRNWNLPVRADTTIEPIPIRMICQLPHYVSLEHVKANIRMKSLASLVNYKNICVVPNQCRFFSLDAVDEPYFTKSRPLNYSPYRHSSFQGKLYITKNCALRVKGFRGISRSCPFKSVRELKFDQTSSERADSRDRNERQ
jgi:hypothetical protein